MKTSARRACLRANAPAGVSASTAPRTTSPTPTSSHASSESKLRGRRGLPPKTNWKGENPPCECIGSWPRLSRTEGPLPPPGSPETHPEQHS
eukprot:4311043-Pyramimonas_sp.AAC.1